MQNRRLSARRFEVAGYDVTFASGVKSGRPVVVYGVKTGLEAVPVFTLEVLRTSVQDAETYVNSATQADALEILNHYKEHHQPMTEKVNHAFTCKSTGFIAPDTRDARYPTRGRR